MSLQTAAAAGPLGVADATARTLLNGAAREPRAIGTMHPFVAGVRRAYQRLPESTRAAAVTAAFAWAKAYVSSPAFTTVYAAARQRAKPIGASTYELTVDQELKKDLDQKLAEIEESKKGLAFIPEADRAQVLVAFKEAEDRVRDPEMAAFLRQEIEARRASDAKGSNDAAAEWNAAFPADVRLFVRQELERFLTASTKIDFTIPITLIKNPAGAIVGFVAPLEGPCESWMEAECMMAGQGMVTAARAAVDEWLKELPR